MRNINLSVTYTNPADAGEQVKCHMGFDNEYELAAFLIHALVECEHRADIERITITNLGHPAHADNIVRIQRANLQEV